MELELRTVASAQDCLVVASKVGMQQVFSMEASFTGYLLSSFVKLEEEMQFSVSVVVQRYKVVNLYSRGFAKFLKDFVIHVWT